MLEEIEPYLDQTQEPNTLNILLDTLKTKDNSLWIMIDNNATIYIQKTFSYNLERTQLKAIKTLVNKVSNNTTINIFSYPNTIPNYLENKRSAKNPAMKLLTHIIATQESKNLTLCYHTTPIEYINTCKQIISPINAHFKTLAPDILLVGRYNKEYLKTNDIKLTDFICIPQDNLANIKRKLSYKKQDLYFSNNNSVINLIQQHINNSTTVPILNPNFIPIYTDGSTKIENNVSAWSVVFNEKRHYSGIFQGTNNDIAELEAIRQALLIVDNNSSIVIYTDHTQQIFWLTAETKIKSPHLKAQILAIKTLIQDKQLTVEYQYVKGHGNNKYNNLAHILANMTANEYCEANIKPLPKN